MRKIKVLHVNSGTKQFGGVSSVLYNLFMNIDRSKISFDFLTPEETTYSMKAREIEERGGSIFEFKIKGNRLEKLVKTAVKTRNFVKKSSYDIIHINSGSFLFNLFVSLAIKSINNRPIIIIHSHNSVEKKKSVKNLIIETLKPVIMKTSDYQISCSKKAAESMFPQKNLNSVKILKNGINLDRFFYDENIRKKKRSDYNLTNNNFVIGNVGRLSYQKNQMFVLKIFREIHKIDQSAVLFLVGNGPDRSKLEEYISLNNLSNDVYLIKETNDIISMYELFDVLLLPSKYEGLPLVGVEAQAVGLPVVFSTEITTEVKITELVTFISLNNSSKEWAKEVLKYENLSKKRISRVDDVRDKGYSIGQVALELQQLYEQIVRRKDEKSH